MIGQMLNIKPIITVDENGYIILFVRLGEKKSISKLTNILKEELEKGKCKFGFFYGEPLRS